MTIVVGKTTQSDLGTGYPCPALFYYFLSSPIYTIELTLCVFGQMFERETKREKILEARHREMRLKERSRSEQSKDEDTKEGDGEESIEELATRTEAEFYEIVEAELKKRAKEHEKKVRRKKITF